MKKSNLTRSLLAACSIVALSAVMYGCVHSGDGPRYSALDLMGHTTAAGATVTAGTYGIDGLPADLASALKGYTGPKTAGAGEALTIGGYTFTCGADSSCSVTVAPDGSHFTTTGTITVALTSAVMPPPVTDDLEETLRGAQTAAAAAADAAKKALDAAQAAVNGLEDKKDDDVPNYTRATDALAEAKKAYDAAKAASDAAAAAEATAEGVAEAEKQQGLAEAAQMKADEASKRAEMFAGEATKLANAKAAAMTAAEAARTAANAAREAADKIKEQLGADSAQYTAADAAATAAETAATAAETASTNAQADTMSADAEAEKTTAEAKKDEAEMKLADATELAREAGVAVAAQDRVRIELAQEAAKTAKTAAMEHAKSARSKATMARTEATKARAAANRAKMARTDYVEADKKATEAETAATAAEAAATAAEAAATAAEAAYMASKADDVTVETARAERDKAQMQQRTAMAKDTGDDGANEQYETAKAAAMEAATAAGEYSLELFKVASGQGLADAEKKARITLVRNLIEDAGDQERDTHVTVGAAKALTPNANGTGTADNSVDGLWQYNTNDNDQIGNNAYGARIEHKIGKDRVYRFGKYSAEHLRTPDPKVTTAQATQRDLPMLGGFTGVELTQGTRAVHIYTDYDTSKRKAATKAGNISGVKASSGTVSGTFDLSTAGTITTLAGSKFTAGGVTYSGTGLEFDCTAPADCSYTSTGAGATATITSLGSGWKVTGSADAVPEAGDPDYMVFGYWLDLGGSTANGQDERLGAFASGNAFGSTIADGVITALTGNATYRGSAAGLHGMTGAKEAVQPFDAKAELTAKFGTAAELGTVEGRIYDINSGGERLTGELSEVILSKGDVNSATSRSFTYYDTRMGTPTVDPTDNSAEYPMNGFWHGRFSEDMAENADAAKKYPTAVIGTFGVSGTLDMGTADNTKDDVTHSLIGAFGTHLEQ